MPPQAVTRESSEYQALAASYPHLSEFIRLRKELERLNQELRSTKERSTRLRIGREAKSLTGKLRQQDLLMRVHGESRVQKKYRTRLLVTNVKQRFASIALSARLRVRKAYLELQKKLQEQSRRSRYARASTLPPSLFDTRSLDPVDRSSALREWIERRQTRIRR